MGKTLLPEVISLREDIADALKEECSEYGSLGVFVIEAVEDAFEDPSDIRLLPSRLGMVRKQTTVRMEPKMIKKVRRFCLALGVSRTGFYNAIISAKLGLEDTGSVVHTDLVER